MRTCLSKFYSWEREFGSKDRSPKGSRRYFLYSQTAVSQRTHHTVLWYVLEAQMNHDPEPSEFFENAASMFRDLHVFELVEKM
jgi:hypothetical protein